jgi:transcriptional regulator GlxA family with amidase domain
MQQRLKTAKELLETSRQSINEICFEVGYSDVTSFNKLFKRYSSLTPATYRSIKTKKSIFTC